MSDIKFDHISEVIDNLSLSKVNGQIKGYITDPKTGEYVDEETITLVVGFGLPSGFVVEVPPEVEKDAVLCYIDGKWVQNKELFTARRIELFEIQRKALMDELSARITRFERLKSVNQLKDEDAVICAKYTNMLFDIEELDATDPNVKLPTIE